MIESSRKRRRAEASLRVGSTVPLDVQLPLLDAIAANPADPEPWAVYADLLQTAGHPRGELVSLMMERERRPSQSLLNLQRRLQAQHAAALLPAALDREAVIAW